MEDIKDVFRRENAFSSAVGTNLYCFGDRKLHGPTWREPDLRLERTFVTSSSDNF